MNKAVRRILLATSIGLFMASCAGGSRPSLPGDDPARTFYFLVDADGQRVYKEQNDVDRTRKHILSVTSAQGSWK